MTSLPTRQRERSALRAAKITTTNTNATCAGTTATIAVKKHHKIGATINFRLSHTKGNETMTESFDPYFDLPNADPPWLTRVIENNGENCGNCGQWRLLSNPIVERCPNCGDDEYNINEAAGQEIP